MNEHEVGEKGFWWKKLCDLQSPLSFHYPPRLLQMDSGGQKKILLHLKAELMKNGPRKWPFGGPGNPQRDTSWTDHAILWWWVDTTNAPFSGIWVLDRRPLPTPFSPPKPPPPPRPCPQCLTMRKRMQEGFLPA